MNDEWLLNRIDQNNKELFTIKQASYRLYDADNAQVKALLKSSVLTQINHIDTLFHLKMSSMLCLSEKLNVAFSTPWCLEVMAAEVSKGGALQAVAHLSTLS